jgi:hypothetical protein
MTRRASGKKNTPDFGKRGLQETAQPERKPTSIERLKRLGSRWWGKTVSRKRTARQAAPIGKGRR